MNPHHARFNHLCNVSVAPLPQLFLCVPSIKQFPESNKILLGHFPLPNFAKFSSLSFISFTDSVKKHEKSGKFIQPNSPHVKNSSRDDSAFIVSEIFYSMKKQIFLFSH